MAHVCVDSATLARNDSEALGRVVECRPLLVRRPIERLMPWLREVERRARELNREVAALFLAARHPRTPWYAKLLMLVIVAYAVSPIDLIPDFIPVIGLLDDVLLLPLGIAIVLRMIPETVMAECRTRAQMNEKERARFGRLGAIGVALVWLLLLVLAASWAHRAFSRAQTDAERSVAARAPQAVRR